VPILQVRGERPDALRFGVAPIVALDVLEESAGLACGGSYDEPVLVAVCA
jgi:hypothetical protein